MSKRLTHEQFLDRVSSRLDEYEILSEYKTAENKIHIRCKKCGYDYWVKPHAFIDGRGCRLCSYRKLAEGKKKSFEAFLTGLPKKYAGYVFSEYAGATAPIVAKCPTCGREHRYSSAKAFTAGTAGCKSCHCPLRKPDEELVRACQENGYTLITRLSPVRSGKYMISQAKVRCNRCGRVSRKTISNISRSGCKYCHKRWSKNEDNIYFWVKSLCSDAKQSVHNVTSKELDIYVPSAKVAIEYNGVYWHSEKYKGKDYHSSKSMECRRLGIRLIHVWEYEWNDSRQQQVLKNIILGALHKLPKRYYARECEVKRYDKGCSKWNELNNFFAKNNIQGNRGGSVVFTLEKDGQVLMAYKFGRPSGGRAKQKYEYEMVRGAAAPGVQVVGGATRLWKHFLGEVKPKSVVYYVDFNYFDGCSVEKLGGRYLGHTDSYKNWWVKENIVKNRDPRNHTKIAELEKQGLVKKVWNAGILTYAFYF